MSPGKQPGPAVLLSCVVLALLLTMPARLLTLVVERACAGHCRITDSTGQAWAGQGRLYLRSDESWFDLGQLQWCFICRQALLRLRLDQGEMIWLSPRRITLDVIDLPANAVLGLRSLKLPAGNWQGRLQLRDTNLDLVSLQPLDWQGKGSINWLQAASPLLADYPLGNYRLDWAWQEQSPSASFSGGSPPEIIVAGSLGASRLDAKVSLNGEARVALDRYLSLIAQASGQGEGQWVISTQLN